VRFVNANTNHGHV